MAIELGLDDEFEAVKQRFLEGMHERTDEIERGVLALEKFGAAGGSTKSEVTEAINPLFSTIHSLKGAAAAHGLSIVSTICHRMEDVLASIRTGQVQVAAEVMTRLLGSVDLMTSYSESYLATGGVDESRFLRSLETLFRVELREGTVVSTRVLVVDASRTIMTMLSRVFEKEQITSSYCVNSYEALGRLLQEPFEVLITSLQTQPFDGTTLIATAKLNPALRNLKTVLLTSDTPAFLHADLVPDFIIQKDNRMEDALGKILQTSQKKVFQVPAKTAPARILYVDDDKDMIDLARVFFRKAPEFQVEFYLEPLKALDRILELPPDLVITDLIMPGLNGEELMKKVQGAQKTRPVPFVILTAESDQVIIRRLTRSGATMIVNKAVGPKGVLEQVKAFFAR